MTTGNRITFIDHQTEKEIAAFNDVAIFPIKVGDVIELNVLNEDPQVWDIETTSAGYIIKHIDTTWEIRYAGSVYPLLIVVVRIQKQK